VLITHPTHGNTVNGTVTVTGTAYHFKGSVQKVYVQIDDSDWELANGTTSWSYACDTTEVAGGGHLVRAASFDGHLYSDCHTVAVNVNNHGNHPPDTPTIPLWSHLWGSWGTYLYSTTTSDPENDNVTYGWDWKGDGVVDEGTGYYPSGVMVSTPHSWDTAGTYFVRVTSQDSHRVQSSLSPPLVVNISGVDNPPNISITKPDAAVYFNDANILPFYTPIVFGGINIEVDVVDEESEINRVEFYIDGDLKYVCWYFGTEESYSWIWNEQAFGRYTMKAVAYDNTIDSANDEIMV